MRKLLTKTDYWCGRFLSAYSQDAKAKWSFSKNADACFKKGINAIMVAQMLLYVSAVMVAAGADPGAGSVNGYANGAVNQLISLVLTLFKYIGIGLFVWGCIQFILATKRTDGESKGEALTTAICGIALTILPQVVSSIGASDEVTFNGLLAVENNSFS